MLKETPLGASFNGVMVEVPLTSLELIALRPTPHFC